MDEERVSLRVARLEEQLAALDRMYTEGLAALKELVEAKHDAAQKAVTLALDNQHELSEKHNDLIRTGERKEQTYATKEELGRVEAWQREEHRAQGQNERRLAALERASNRLYGVFAVAPILVGVVGILVGKYVG